MMYPPSVSNQITIAYYMHLIKLINDGISNRKVLKVLHCNGAYIYFTYHLIDIA